MEELFNQLLRKFEFLPKPDINPTFLDICQMRGDRFEERCSQILKFYLSPLAPHKLRGLFLDTLLEVIGMENNYSIQKVKVITEESTDERKRIDITVIADDFVIAIENKIWADVYNPLDNYTTYINSHYKNKDIKKFIVLSVKNITKSDELNKLRKNHFTYINYKDFFTAIKSNLGKYAVNCDQSYLIFLFDFMKTIERKYINNNMELNKFFFEHKNDVENLLSQYDTFKQSILNDQIQLISQIHNEVNKKTGASWSVWQKWDLYISFNDETNRIGIESSFRDENMTNPIGDFHIYITVWNKKCFFPYKEELIKSFGNYFIDYDTNPGRVYMHLPAFSYPYDSDKINLIVQKLSEYYEKLREITNRIK